MSAFGDQSPKHPTIAQGKALPKKIWPLPIDIRVSEIAAGSAIEQVDEWSKKAQSNINNAIRNSATQVARVESLLFVDLSSAISSLFSETQTRI